MSTEKKPLEDTTEEFRAIVAEMLGVSITDVGPGQTFAELGADELDMVEIALETRERFDLTTFGMDEDAHFRLDNTVGRLAETVHKLWN